MLRSEQKHHAEVFRTSEKYNSFEILIELLKGWFGWALIELIIRNARFLAPMVGPLLER